MRWPNFCAKDLAQLSTMLVAPFDECTAGPVSLPPSGNKQARSDVTMYCFFEILTSRSSRKRSGCPSKSLQGGMKP